jgi:hypothetical protein
VFWMSSLVICGVASVALLIAGKWYGGVTAAFGILSAVAPLWGPERSGVDPSQSALQRLKGRRP